MRNSRGLLICKRCGQSFDALASLSEKLDKGQTRFYNDSSYSFERAELRKSSWFWGVASLSMVAVLLAQIIYFDGLSLYSKPIIHSGLSSVCRTLNCRLPIITNPEDWSVSHSELQAYLNGRYWVTAALTNQSEITQALPELKLRLTDFNGQPLTERVFLPYQYSAQPWLQMKPC